ncbi:hypothetical protein RRG08_009565 [Elysia crispata]|uniref:Uncharacterized protein n=1 Tax=Elysia crispata TaxID=231223 RepID=A0AAE0ZHI4_9GAST|nr:hypothetical protein RRG08_009565 [Elysia crispata]
MKSVLTAVILLMVFQARCDKVCQPPQSESLYYLTSSMSDFYVANDFDQGLVLVAFGDNGHVERWALVDLNNRLLYLNTPESGCQYMEYTPEQKQISTQCLPDDAKLERSGEVDFYTMFRPGFTWLVGMKPVPNTEFYYRHFSRFFQENVVNDENTYGVVYKYSLGISDPTVFDKDLSACVEKKLVRAA